MYIDLTLEREKFCLDVNITLPTQGVTAIFGPSGSGKTSLLRCIAGLETSARGELRLGQSIWQSDDTFVAPHRRSLAYVFQESSLFPHVNVRGNLEFAIKRSRSKQKAGVFDNIVSLCDVASFLDREVATLSGGERQRVAIARALLSGPDLLLMDEPLASLDEIRKQELLPFFEKLAKDLHIPIIYVSHAINEVMRLADHIVLMDNGKVKNQGPLVDVLNDPAIYPDRTLGVILEGVIKDCGIDSHLARIDFGGGDLLIYDSGYQPQQTLRLRVLASDVSLVLEKPQHTSILNILPATVVSLETGDLGVCRVTLAVGDVLFFATVTQKSVAKLNVRPDLELWIQIKSVALVR